MEIEYEHCPHCPDQGWYQVTKTRWVEYWDGYNYVAGAEPYPDQEQCEWCWNNPNSYFLLAVWEEPEETEE